MPGPFLLQEITTHVQDAIDRLLSQFDEAPNIVGFLGAFTEQVQDLEACIYELLSERMLDPDPSLGLTPAEGAQLDAYGKIVGLSRGGLSDDDYRALIKVQLTVNDATGTIDSVITTVASFLGINEVTFAQLQPAHIQLFFVLVGGATAQQLADLNALLPKVVPAGVGWDVIQSIVPDDEVFRFDTPGQGFDEGKFAGTIAVESMPTT